MYNARCSLLELPTALALCCSCRSRSLSALALAITAQSSLRSPVLRAPFSHAYPGQVGPESGESVTASSRSRGNGYSESLSSESEFELHYRGSLGSRLSESVFSTTSYSTQSDHRRAAPFFGFGTAGIAGAAGDSSSGASCHDQGHEAGGGVAAVEAMVQRAADFCQRNSAPAKQPASQPSNPPSEQAEVSRLWCAVCSFKKHDGHSRSWPLKLS